MRVVKVTRKFQVTIPKDLAESAGIRVGDLVTVDLTQDGSLIVRKFNLLEGLAGALNPGRRIEHLAEELDQERKAAER
jgi:AbrB family looped-hinge helix DNA binding protein